MKKLILLFTFVMTVCYSEILSQSLYNTTWEVYTPGKSFVVYIHLGNDTLFFSTDNITYKGGSTFTVSSNNFLISDYNGTTCGSMIGEYTFKIHNDTLSFTLINEGCLSRKEVIADFYWIRLHLPTDIQQIDKKTSIVLYPNPTQGLLTIPVEGYKHIIISNIQGQVISKLFTESGTVDLKDLTNGFYFVSVYNNHNKLIGRQKINLEK